MAKAHRHSDLVAGRIVPIALALLLAACVFIYLVRLRRVSIGADDYGYLSYARSIVEYKSLRMHYPPIEKLLELERYEQLGPENTGAETSCFPP